MEHAPKPPATPVAPATWIALNELITRHAWVLDHGDPRDLGSLYTEDGSLIGLGEPLVGRAAIDRWALERAEITDRTSRHVHTNVRITVDDDGVHHGLMTTLLFRHDGEGPGPTTPFIVNDYQDTYRQEPDGTWLIAERVMRRVFIDGSRIGGTSR
ncbi:MULTISPECIES: nuclear transport factor 2 family protein [unclassified Spirillospora]|jgi:hypothetical protein|uniref:nuclear transport factor 2 family protein n=1 Tax=unclassified Spirillospora TaxID=2642701 RepID=UPI003720D7CC